MAANGNGRPLDSDPEDDLFSIVNNLRTGYDQEITYLHYESVDFSEWATARLSSHEELSTDRNQRYTPADFCRPRSSHLYQSTEPHTGVLRIAYEVPLGAGIAHHGQRIRLIDHACALWLNPVQGPTTARTGWNRQDPLPHDGTLPQRLLRSPYTQYPGFRAPAPDTWDHFTRRRGRGSSSLNADASGSESSEDSSVDYSSRRWNNQD